MSVLEVLLLALALALDALTVGAAVGAKACERRQVFRLTLHFGVFQALMPVLGALLGRAVVDLVQGFTGWVAFGLLALIGGKMTWGALRRRPECAAEPPPGCPEADPTRGWSLVGLSLATSVDALGAGVGMGVLMGWLQLAWAVAVIGLVAAGATWLGMRAGRTVICRLGRRAEAVAGLVLIGLGVKMLFDGVALG